MMKRKRTVFIIAGIAVIALLAIILTARHSGAIASAPALAQSARHDISSSDPAKSSTSRRRATARALPEGAITTHSAEQLKDFILRDCRGQQISLHGALKRLDEAYRDACYFSLEKPLDLKYIVESTDDRLISFSIKGKTWKSSMAFIAALAGCEVKIDGLNVTVSPLPQNDGNAEFDSDISDRMQKKLWLDLIDRGDLLADAPAPGLEELLKLAGIVSEEFSLMAATPRDIAALRAWQDMENEPQNLFTIQTKLIHSSQALDATINQLDANEADEWLRSISQQNGVTLTTVPTVSARDGQPATIEQKQGQGEQWTGMHIQYQTEAIGLKNLSINETLIRSQEPNTKEKRAETQYLVSDGNSQIKQIGHDSSGYLYQMTSISQQSNNIIFNKGTSYKTPPGTFPVAKPIPGKEGFVFSPYNNSIVDVSGMQPGTLVADPQFPSSEKKYFRLP